VHKNIKITGFLFKDRIHWQSEMGGKISNDYFRLRICLHTYETLIRNFYMTLL